MAIHRKEKIKHAIEHGAKHYFTGKPCKYGHLAKRSVSNGTCWECKNEWRRGNRAKTNYADGVAYRIKYPNKRRENYIKNKEAQREYEKKYHIKNKERLKAKAKEYRAKNKSKFAARSAKNRVARLQTQRKAIPLWFSLEEVNKIYEKRDFLIKRTGIPHHVDHIIPLRGKIVCGLHVHTNLQILTAEENMKKFNHHDVD